MNVECYHVLCNTVQHREATINIRRKEITYESKNCSLPQTVVLPDVSVGRVSFKEPPTTEPVLSLQTNHKKTKNCFCFRTENRGGRTAALKQGTQLSREKQTAELQIAPECCIPDSPPSTLSSAHHVLYVSSPAEHTEELCLYWWIILKRKLQKYDGRTHSRDGQAMRGTIRVSIPDRVSKTSRQTLVPPISCAPEALSLEIRRLEYRAS